MPRPIPEESIPDILARYEARGYTGQFGVRPAGRVICFTCRREGEARAFLLDALHRLEGASNPNGEAAVAAVRCPHCRARGTVILAYGPGAPVEDGLVLRDLRDNRQRSGIPPGL